MDINTLLYIIFKYLLELYACNYYVCGKFKRWQHKVTDLSWALSPLHPVSTWQFVTNTWHQSTDRGDYLNLESTHTTYVSVQDMMVSTHLVLEALTKPTPHTGAGAIINLPVETVVTLYLGVYSYDALLNFCPDFLFHSKKWTSLGNYQAQLSKFCKLPGWNFTWSFSDHSQNTIYMTLDN